MTCLRSRSLMRSRSYQGQRHSTVKLQVFWLSISKVEGGPSTERHSSSVCISFVSKFVLNRILCEFFFCCTCHVFVPCCKITWLRTKWSSAIITYFNILFRLRSLNLSRQPSSINVCIACQLFSIHRNDRTMHQDTLTFSKEMRYCHK